MKITGFKVMAEIGVKYSSMTKVEIFVLKITKKTNRLK